MYHSDSDLDRALMDRLGGANVFAAIRRACVGLLVETGMQNLPTKLSVLARHLGATIRYGSDVLQGNEEAALKLVNNRIVLCVSRAMFENYRTRPRARFSIAHEIGHLILFKLLGSKTLEYSDANRRAYQRIELLCDVAASHLLMPRSELSGALRAHGFTPHGTNEIRGIFDVSAAALFKAVADLVPDGAVLEWRYFRRHLAEEQTWRVLRAYTASGPTCLASWMPLGCTLKHIEGLDSPSTLSLGKPEGRAKLTLSLGNSWATRDAVVCLWPLNGNAPQRALLSLPRRQVSSIVQDASQGRLMMVVGKRGRLDYRQFGAENVA